MTNNEFLDAITRSFVEFLRKGTSRSTDKLKPLHGSIAADIAGRLGNQYKVLSQGYGSGKEGSIKGRYSSKKVDITITKEGMAVAGIAVKFVMQNYSQNSNNYFDNMLGETANIRSVGCPYFQIFIILDKLPYYNKEKRISKWETFSDHNISKYVVLSKDDVDVSIHTPNQTLIYVVHLPEPEENIETGQQYLDYYRTHEHSLSLTKHRYDEFENAVLLNDYETFIQNVYNTIMTL